MLTEFYRKIAVGPRPPVVILCAVIYAFFVIRSLCWGFLWDWSIWWEMVPTLVTMGVVFTALYFLPDFYAWQNLRRIKKQNDGVAPETVVTVGDTIEMREGMVHYTIEYRKLKKVICLKHSYALMTGKRNGLILNPNCFTKGTFAEFKQFLREKRPDLNIPE